MELGCGKTCFVAVGLFSCVALAQDGMRGGQWLSYGADSGSTKYSALDQIDASNVSKLRVAWRWESPANALTNEDSSLVEGRFEATPLMVDGVLYISTGFSQIAAIDAGTGETLWVHDPESWKNGRPANLGFVNRGVAYWTDGDDARIFVGTGDARLIALNAKTGEPYADFGDDGSVDLTKGLRRPVNRRGYSVSSAPIVCRDVVAVGASISDGVSRKTTPPGDVRGFDVRTGKQLWSFHSIPQEGEFGVETWKDESWKYSGNANVWTLMSADPELGYFYLPFGTATDDWYGGHRKGNNLFAESLVCVKADTGERVWHFQMVHHGLWDYDLPAAPNLVDIVVDGRAIKAVAQVSKQGFCYVFDRATGKPVWPIEERPVPGSNLEGEEASPTQPFPTKPAPFERQGLTKGDLIDFTTALRSEAQEILSKFDYGPLFTPPSERGAINMPGWVGGANYSGAAFDPETGMLYVPSVAAPIMVTTVRPDPERSNLDYVGNVETLVEGPQGLPLIRPPYSRVTAIDLNTGEHEWMVPLGDGPRSHPKLKGLNLGPLGSGARGFPLLTKSLLFVCQEAYLYTRGENDPYQGRGDGVSALRAFDKATGEMVYERKLEANCSAAPITYLVDGKQYLVIAVSEVGKASSELIAFALGN